METEPSVAREASDAGSPKVQYRRLSLHIPNKRVFTRSNIISKTMTSEAGSEGTMQYQPNVVESRKGSMVTIDQIPYIVQESLRYMDFDTNAPDTGNDGQSTAQRMSIFSMQSRRSSAQSDVTFYDPQERLPAAEHYGQLGGFRQRPTLYQLREEPESPTKPPAPLGDDLEDTKDEEAGQLTKEVKQAHKKGWFQGVFVRCLLNIFGVMLFLRLTWVTGQAGIGLGSVIVLLSTTVTLLTTMSMAAICTNGEVKGGGAYYMISRSLGPEFGGAIGVIFSLANAVGAAMHIVGFAETVRDLVLDSGGVITGDNTNDVRVIGPVTTVVLMTIVMIGLDFETKAQLVLLVILVIAITNYLVGTFIPPSETDRRVGFVGYSGETLMANFGPSIRTQNNVDYDFFKIFGIYFPTATGILAGANISGDLKNPSSAIPKGTFLAILVTSLIYLMIIWTSGSCMLRDAVGAAADNMSLSIEEIQSCVANGTCGFGLINSHDIMGVASAFKPLIYAGIFSATLSSALASLVSAPKVFQALGKDRLFPFIEFFAKEYGKDLEPRRGYVLTFFICAAMTCIGSLDYLAPIISNFFLMAYCLINVACFDAAFVNSPGFRPSFHFYNKWCSLAGALLCVAIMFLIQWWAALVTIVLVAALYAYIKYKKPDANWGSTGQAHAYNAALKSALKLTNVDEHVKNFRPQLLVLTGYPKNRPALVDFAYTITKRQSLLVCAHIFQGDMQQHVSHLHSTVAYNWFRNRGLRAFYTSVAAPTVRHGVQGLLQSFGLGKLKPNTLLMGYKKTWQTVDPSSVHNYVGIIHDAFDLRFGVGILRVPGGLETYKIRDSQLDVTDEMTEDLDLDLFEDDASNDEEESEETVKAERKRKMSTIFQEKQNGEIPLKSFKQHTREGVVNTGYTHSNRSDDDGDFKSADDDNAIGVKAVRNSVSANPGSNDSKIVSSSTKDNACGQQHEEKGSHATAFNSAQNEAANDGLDAGHGEKDSEKSKSALLSLESTGETTIGNYFRGRQKGTIDVWWLFDDGGLGLLVPYILSTRKKWHDCSLRLFCAGTKRANLDEDRRKMAALLNKFRIEYSDITILPDIKKKPQRSSYKEFEEMIYPWRLRPGERQDDYPWKVSDDDLIRHKQKIYMQLRIREKLLEQSAAASLIVLTLPVPRRFCPAGLYMTWLEILTRDLPPTLLLRGNQQSVLTYFS